MTRTRTRKTTDQRVARTHRALHHALIALILERGWDHTSVQTICDRANVGRSTFYTHFESKEKLLLSGFNELRQMLREQARAAGTEPLSFLRGLIDHVSDQRKLFRSVIGRRSSHVVHIRFRETVRHLVAEDFAGFAAPGWQREAAVHYVAGALVETLAWWVDAKNAIVPDEIEQYFRQLALPVVAQLKARSA